MPISESPIVTAHGKFLSRSGRKFFFKAVRLEAQASALNLARQVALRQRFNKLADAHTTSLIVDALDADRVVDIAAQAGLCALVEIRVAPEALFDRIRFRDAVARIASTARTLQGRSNLAGYLIDCPIADGLIRDRGLERVRSQIRRLIKIVRRVNSNALVSIKHRAATRGISVPDEDFIYSVVPPLGPADLKEYVVSLHNLAQSRPVIIEFENGAADQDDLVACAFGLGTAGVVAPPIPALPKSDSLSIKMLTADDRLPFVTLNGSCPPQPVRTPAVSVVICAYNAERTMRDCLESLRKLDYPSYEVIIVDDGSRDRTAEIATDFPEFRLIRQPNKGLSVARNVGMHAARGEIVAYTDSDCVVDPHWLTFMIRAMGEGGFDGAGGPNYAPHEDGRIEACVAASPGAPCHVLVGEDRAEHLAGCNMVFSKGALLAIGGFDPQFTSAGDDVDICWRLIGEGYRLGFCPSAFVWHFRRNTVKAYYGQQRGYGRAEAMLYAKYPDRFNALGQIKWQGTIPGLARTIPGGSAHRVMWSAARPGLQTVYEPMLTLLHFLPQTFEWNLVAAIALAASLASHLSVIPALAMFAMSPLWATYYAMQAPLEKCHRGLVSRMVVAWLAYTGPIARAMTRYKLRFSTGGHAVLATDLPARQRPKVVLRDLAFRLAYWNETYTTRDSLLDRLHRLFTHSGYPSTIDRGWNDFDLEVCTGPCTKVQIKTADEEHGGMKLRNLAVVRVRLTILSKGALIAGVIATIAASLFGIDRLAFVIGTLTILGAAVVASEGCESMRTGYRAVEQCAHELDLIPLGAKTRAAARADSSAPASRPEERRPLRPLDLLDERPAID